MQHAAITTEDTTARATPATMEMDLTATVNLLNLWCRVVHLCLVLGNDTLADFRRDYF